MKKNLNQREGITLISLIITIIILLILAGISIYTISGGNGTIQRTIDAREALETQQIIKTINIAYMAVTSKNNLYDVDVSDVLTSKLEKEYGAGNVFVSKFEETYEIEIKEKGIYKINADGNVESENNVLADRTDIHVGDYVQYIPSNSNTTTSVTFNKDETGYSAYASNPQTVNRKSLFRVLDIDRFGNIELMGVITSSDTAVYFSGAQGYNNSLYTLNKKCSDLYKDESLGITARSIKIEDITDRMIEGTKGATTDASTGRKKLEKYIDEQIAPLSTDAYITEIDKDINKITITTNTYYPDIFQHEEGGKIGDVLTSGEIKQSEYYSGYNGITSAGVAVTSTTKPTTLTATFTYYNVGPVASDFDNTKGNAAAWKNMFFDTGGKYWIASRCIDYSKNGFWFRVRDVNNTKIGGYFLHFSKGEEHERSRSICPIVRIPSNVEVTPCTGTNSSSNCHTVVTTN